MSYKISLILSFIFVIIFFLFGMDLLSVQYIYTDLDSKATNISYLISKKGDLEENFIKSIEANYQISFECLKNCTPKFGDLLEFKISKPYNPIIISKETINVSVKRSTVIGYYQ